MVFLPEGFDSISESKETAIMSAESLDDVTITSYRSLAKKKQLWLSLGGFKEKVFVSFFPCKLYDFDYEQQILTEQLGQLL